MIDLREKKFDEKFDIDKEFDKVMKRFNKEKKQLPGKTDMDKIDYILSSSDYDDDEYDSLYDRIEDYLKNDESCNGKKKEAEDEIKFVNKGEKFKSEKGDDIEIVDIKKDGDKTIIVYKLGKEEKKNNIEDVIKMLNGAGYEIVKKNDDDKDDSDSKKEATEKKFVIYCTSTMKDLPSGYVGDIDNFKSLEDLIKADGKHAFFDSEKKAQDFIDGDETIQANIKDGAKYSVKDVTDEVEKLNKKESVEHNYVEVTLTEDFHVPGTDVILEKGDVIQIIPKVEG